MNTSLQYILHDPLNSIKDGFVNVYPIGPYGSGFVDYGCIGNRSYVESTSRKPAYRIHVKPYTSWSIRCRLRSDPNSYIYVGHSAYWSHLSIHHRRFKNRQDALEYLRDHKDNWSWWTRDHAEVYGNHG